MTRELESALRHAGYVIYHDGTEFVAEPETPEDPIFEMGSQSVDRLLAMIDELWAAITSATSFSKPIESPPPWFETFLSGEVNGRVNVDVAPWVYDKQKFANESPKIVAVTVDNTDFPDILQDVAFLSDKWQMKGVKLINVRNAHFQEYIIKKYANRARARRENRRLTQEPKGDEIGS